MKKTLFIVLAALLTCAYANAVEVNSLAGLQSALAAGGEITLTADIDAGSTALTVSQGITLKGNGHCVKSTAGYVFSVTTTSAVKFENLIIYAAKTSAGRGIAINDLSDTNVALDNVTINAQERGMDIFCSNSANTIENVTLSIKNSTIQHVHANYGISYDAQGNPSNPAIYNTTAVSVNSSYSRGVNIGRLVNSNITIENTTIQGFFYNVNNIGGTMAGTTITTSNCTFKGRCAYNIWGQQGNWIANDANVLGLNNWGGPQESFACFVLYGPMDGGDSRNNYLTINGGTLAAASFNAVGMANPNARQFLLSDRGTNNVVVVNNASYTCTKEAEDSKGGVVEISSSTSNITINGGNYDCPNIVGATYSDGEGNTGTITITGGEFNVNTVAPDMTDGDVYSTVEIEGGTYDIASGSVNQVDPNDPTNTLVVASKESYDNQNGSEIVVPIGTNDDTEQKDPAVIKDLVWGSDIDRSAVNVKLQPTQTLTLASGVATANKLDMGQDTKIIVKDGTILTIGEGGVALNNDGDKDPQIVVEAGGVAIVKGQMYGSVVENLLIQTSETKHGVLLFDPDMNTYGDNHPKGTVEFITKSYYAGGSDYQFERFGIPTWTTVESIDCNVEGLVTTLYVLGNSGWQNIGDLVKGTPFANIAQLNKPFATYNLLARQATPGATYKIAGALSGNGNAELYANLKWNSFANSYTADVNVGKLLEGLEGASDIDATVYVLSPAGNHTYVPDAIDAVWASSTKIAPMQTFLLNNVGGNNEYTSINYKNAVWSPATASAPARRKQEHDLTAKLRINVMNEQGVWDNLKMSESMTNIHNAEKYMGEDINLYAYDGDDKLAIVAAEDLNGTYIGFSTVNGGKFTLSFANVEGREFDLIDLEENVTVSVVEGNTYTFSAAKNTNADYRFKLVESKRVVTDVDKIATEKNVKGIYTIMGQYVGEMNMWNNLPAGIYVVNGEKRVK